MKKLIFIPVLFTLGCATQTEITAATESTVVVRAGLPDLGVEKALMLAENECKKKGKSAIVISLTSPRTDKYIFNCI